MVRRLLLPLVLATAICVAVLLAVHRPPLTTPADLRLLAMLCGLAAAGVAAVLLLLTPVVMLLRVAAFPFAVTVLTLVIAAGVIGKALLWLVLPGVPMAAMVPGMGAAALWLAFNRERLG